MTESRAGESQERGEEDLVPKVIVSEGAVNQDGETAPLAPSAGSKNDASSSSLLRKEEDTMAIDVNATAPVKAIASEPASPTLSESRARLQRSSSKIASLRAAFERKSSDGSQDLERFKSRSPSGRSFREQDIDGKARDTEIAKLKDRLEKETELRKAVEEKCTALEDQNEKLQAKLQRQDGEWQAEMARQSAVLMEERDSARGEFVDIQNKLLGLKRSISASTRVENQVADSTFVQEMQKMYHEVQNWVVNNFRRVKLEKSGDQLCARLESIAETKQLEYLKSIFQNFSPTTPSTIKLSAFQAVVACYLMEIFDDPLIFGLPSSQDWRKSIRKTSDTLYAVLPRAAYNKWRATTLDVIKQGIDIREPLDSASRSLSEMVCITLSSLTDLDASSMIPSLNAIVKRIISLSHVFRVQRAQYEFFLPLPGDPFDSAKMDGDEASPESTTVQQRSIRCALFPSVTKRGDELGDNAQLANVVVKAKVSCYT